MTFKMESITIRAVFISASLLIAPGAFAATVWMPTDSDMNIIDTQGGTVAIFDEADTGLMGSKLELAVNDRVDFTSSGSDFVLTNLAGDDITLTGDNRFRLGFREDGSSAWTDEATWFDSGNNVMDILFGSFPGPATGRSMVADVSAVPLPAPLLLLASGLFGLATVGRRLNPRKILQGVGNT